MNPEELLSNLRQFIGTENYHRFSYLFPKTFLTDGAKYLADEAGCYWLMDIIGSIEPKVRKEDFLTYKFVKKGSGGEFTADDGNGNILYSQNIPFTDFPLDKITLYGQCDHLGNRIIMLTSEY